MQGKRLCIAQTVLNQNRENNGSEFRKLKELARYARLGKLKANSFAVELGG